eukprot:3842280-Rhodomonas_salina.1
MHASLGPAPPAVAIFKSPPSVHVEFRVCTSDNTSDARAQCSFATRLGCRFSGWHAVQASSTRAHLVRLKLCAVQAVEQGMEGTRDGGEGKLVREGCKGEAGHWQAGGGSVRWWRA